MEQTREEVSEVSAWKRMQEQRQANPTSPTNRTLRQDRGIFGDYSIKTLEMPTLAKYEKLLDNPEE